MTVYIDVLFLSNFLSDLFILFCTGLILRDRSGVLKLSAGAAVMSLYSVLIILPRAGPLFTGAGKGFFIILFVILYYKCRGVRDIIKKTVTLLSVTLIFGGVGFFALCAFPEFNMSITALLCCCAAALILIRIFTAVLQKNTKREFQAAEVITGSRISQLNILLDTGCELYEPLSGAPVILASGVPFESGRAVGAYTAYGSGIIYVRKPDIISPRGGKYLIGQCYIGYTALPENGLYNAVASPDAFYENSKKYTGRIFDVQKIKDAAAQLVSAFDSAKRILHRRERNTSAAPAKGRGEKVD